MVCNGTIYLKAIFNSHGFPGVVHNKNIIGCGNHVTLVKRRMIQAQ